MTTYLIRRLVLVIPTLFIVTLTVAALIRLVSGDVAELMIGEAQFSGDLDELRARMGVDRPFHIQYVSWLGDMLRGDLGTSLTTGRPATTDLTNRMPVTLELGILSLMMSTIISIPIGVLAAMKRDTAIDFFARTYVIVGLAVPSFWIATLAIIVGSVQFGWSPQLVYVPLWEDPVRNLKQFLPPALILGAFGSATLMRMTRTTVLEVMGQDYVRTARAKGLTESRVTVRHVLRNSMIPVITVIGLQVPFLLGGSVVLEQIFALPGMGKWTLDVINRRDYPMLQTINLLFALLIVGTNLAVDMLYAAFDPRIRYR
jgi:peptide/nickel transport system permease protein